MLVILADVHGIFWESLPKTIVQAFSPGSPFNPKAYEKDIDRINVAEGKMSKEDFAKKYYKKWSIQ